MYVEICSWDSNLFMLPRGNNAKGLITEMSRLLNLFNDKTPWETVALDLLHIFIPIMLQKPSRRPTNREKMRYLGDRLKRWKEGDIDSLFSECQEIQKRLRRKNTSNSESDQKAFCRLMLEGKISKAMRFINHEDRVIGVHEPNEDIIDILKSKHPVAKPAPDDCLLEPPSTNVPPVIFEAIDADLIYSNGRTISGSGGPKKVDLDTWQILLCSKAYGPSSGQLRQAVADCARRLCREQVDHIVTEKLNASRLIPLNKNPGVRPIGIGEILRRVICKAVSRVLRPDIVKATGALQTCSGISGGIKASVHAMAKIFRDEASEAILLVDADNAFNSLNREAAINNIKSLCQPYYMFQNNIYQCPSRLFVSGSREVLLSEEGTTQGDPGAMNMYAIAVRPLIDHLDNFIQISPGQPGVQFPQDDDGIPERTNAQKVRQCWYADDSAAGGSIAGLKLWLDELCSVGPGYGYYPKPSKSVLIVKNDPVTLERARTTFAEYDIAITTDGDRHLGAAIGSNLFNGSVKWLKSKWLCQVAQIQGSVGSRQGGATGGVHSVYTRVMTTEIFSEIYYETYCFSVKNV